jgi:hypothetical protein
MNGEEFACLLGHVKGLRLAGEELMHLSAEWFALSDPNEEEY